MSDFFALSHLPWLELTAPWIFVPPGAFLTDLGANFWLLPYRVNPDQMMAIRGRFPHCRYISHAVYNLTGMKTVSNAYDQIIMPDPGNTNPFLPGNNFNAKPRDYTVLLKPVPAPEPAHPYFPASGSNILYAGSLPDGSPNRGGILLYRVYLPGKGYDPTGGVGLPKVFVRSRLPEPSDAQPYSLSASLNNPHPSLSEPTPVKDPEKLVWYRQPSVGVPWPNPLSVYIYARLTPDPKRLLYLTWKAPGFPDTAHDNGITGTENMRYWSFSFGTAYNEKTSYSIADYQFVIAPDGYARMLVGFGAPRPDDATSQNGITWVDLANLPATHIIYRNTLFGGFPFTAGEVPYRQEITDQLGPYQPVGRYVPAGVTRAGLQAYLSSP